MSCRVMPNCVVTSSDHDWFGLLSLLFRESFFPQLLFVIVFGNLIINVDTKTVIDYLQTPRRVRLQRGFDRDLGRVELERRALVWVNELS